MGNNVTIGRLKHEHHVDLLKTGQYSAQAVELDAYEYCCIKNYPVEAFLDILETTVRHPNTWCWSIPDIAEFIQECERKMPKLIEGDGRFRLLFRLISIRSPTPYFTLH